MAEDQANINVIVRCRARNKREITAKSAVIVKVPRESNNEITLNTSDEVGLAGDMKSQTFSVDSVYGPEVDQSQFFQGSAESLFKDFIKGYNCTIFAYGQTGAGKTYTMHGDQKIDSKTGTYSEHAGIIPRILYTLFETLHCLNCNDFIVKVSFLELYNETLKDLLSEDENKSLRIFEKTKYDRCSITTSNLDEIILKNAQHGMKLLQNGLNKRQVAATKLNDVSSRSHTIFTISLYKQESADSKEYRISKFNLVDLAGSENIKKSGTLSLRVREAGSINQSLLTLGRVINGLVNGDNHIPYRESKLTRLLQDSLGGKTKTVLIANISPAKINCEETLSTLKYASKAKNIKNKPQIGTIVMKDTLIRELGSELSRLKADLMSSRSKNGIYVEEDNYREIQLELENLKTEREELRTQNQLLQRQVSTFNSEIQQSNSKIASKNEELANLNNVIKELYEKIDRQSLSQRSLIENSSKFNNIVDMYNENILTLLNNKEEMKNRLSKLVNDELQQELNDLNFSYLQVDQIDSIRACFQKLQENSKSISLKIAQKFMSNLPSVCDRVINDLKAIEGYAQNIANTHRESEFVIEDILTKCENFQTMNSSKVTETLRKQYEDQIVSQMSKEQDSFIKQMESMIKENCEKQRSLLSDMLISQTKSIIDDSNSSLKQSQTEIKLVADANIKTINSTYVKNKAGLNSKIKSLEEFVHSINNDTNTSESEMKAQFDSIKSQQGLEFNIDEPNKILNLVMKDVNKLNKVKTGIHTKLNTINEVVIQEMGGKTEDLPHEINQMIKEIRQEHVKINGDLVPTGKTPSIRNDAYKLSNKENDDNNKAFISPTRSTSKRILNSLKKQPMTLADLIYSNKSNMNTEDDSPTRRKVRPKTLAQSPRRVGNLKSNKFKVTKSGRRPVLRNV